MAASAVRRIDSMGTATDMPMAAASVPLRQMALI
jgi:hypothetical protein